MGQLFSKSTQTTEEVLFLKTKSESTKTDDTGEIPAEKVAELRVPTHQKVQTSNFRTTFGGFLSRHEGKTVNNSTFAP